MKKIFVIVILLLLFGAAGVLIFKTQRNKHQPASIQNKQTNNQLMEIKSAAFANNQPIPAKYTCDGENINPPLEFSGIPKQAQSLALIVDDPDAPMGTWVHWTLWNMLPHTFRIEENLLPAGAVQGKTSSGQNVYGGPCPPNGTHRYFFKLYALDTKLNIPSYSEKKDLEKAMEGHIISQAQLIGLYSRNH